MIAIADVVNTSRSFFGQCGKTTFDEIIDMNAIAGVAVCFFQEGITG